MTIKKQSTTSRKCSLLGFLRNVSCCALVFLHFNALTIIKEEQENQQIFSRDAERVLFSSNSINSLIDSDRRNDAYHIVSILPFPMNSNPLLIGDITNLLLSTENSVSDLYCNEWETIEKQLTHCSSDIKSYYMPKSLYQLFALLQYYKDVTSDVTPGENYKAMWLFNIHCADSYIFDYGDCNGHGVKLFLDDGSFFSYCKSYAERHSVQALFWRINDSIIDFMRQNDIKMAISLNQDTLTKIIDVLFTKFDELDKKVKGTDNISFSDLRPLQDINTKNKPLLRLLLKMEYNIMINSGMAKSFSVYRCSPYIINEKNVFTMECPLSFSSNLLAGLVGDFFNGSVFSYLTGSCDLRRGEKSQLIRFSILPYDDSGNKMFSPIFIPPVTILGTLIAKGEFHHPRIKTARILQKDFEYLMRQLDPDRCIPCRKVSSKCEEDLSKPSSKFYNDTCKNAIDAQRKLKKAASKSNASSNVCNDTCGNQPDGIPTYDFIYNNDLDPLLMLREFSKLKASIRGGYVVGPLENPRYFFNKNDENAVSKFVIECTSVEDLLKEANSAESDVENETI
ncbi:MAG: hypothetical protein LBB25_02260 [Holosporaceae bacterium]|nr:hypothetical protein [Holosporaceae bacterium]